MQSATYQSKAQGIIRDPYLAELQHLGRAFLVTLVIFFGVHTCASSRSNVTGLPLNSLQWS